MEKNKKRSFRELKKSMQEKELLQFCKKVATEYANSPMEFARSYFMNKYDITESCFYRILEEAIINNMISDDIIKKMEIKSINNQKSHNALAGARTHIHYCQIICKRDEKIISLLTDKEIEDIAIEFAYSKLTKAEFAKENEISKRVLDLLLKKSIEEAIVDDIVMYAIKERSIKNSKNPKETEEFFSMLIEKRNIKISELLSE